MKKSFKVLASVSLGLVVLTGCEGQVKVGQNDDGSMNFSLVSTVMNESINISGDLPISVDQPPVREEPVVVDEDTTPEEPVVVDEDTTPEEPVVVDEDTTPEEPVVVDEDTTTEEPVIVDSGDYKIEDQNVYTGFIEWTPAGHFEDGTAMNQNEISHYELVYGASLDKMTEVVSIAVSGLNHYELSELPQGNWKVALRTVSVYGTVSSPSSVIQVSI